VDHSLKAAQRRCPRHCEKKRINWFPLRVFDGHSLEFYFLMAISL
jgi:hypothetical protein